MGKTLSIALTVLVALGVAGCQTTDVVNSERTPEENMAANEKEKSRQLHDEYMMEQMRKQEEIRAARERAEEAARAQREAMSRP